MKKEEIRQNGRTILSSEDGFSIRMFFNNLIGKNFTGKDRNYFLPFFDFLAGTSGAPSCSTAG